MTRRGFRAIGSAVVLLAAGACANTSDETKSRATTSLIPEGIVGSHSIYILNGRIFDGGITLKLKRDGTYSGDGPCNQYSGRYDVGPGLSFSLSIPESTERACDELALEKEYFATFNDVVEYRTTISGGLLNLLDDTGTAVLSFTPENR